MVETDFNLPEGEKILITGGAGFIGSTLAGLLVEKNKVIVLDDFTRDSITDKDFKFHDNIKIFKGSIINPIRLTEEDDITMIIHCAAIAGVDSVMKDSVHTMKVNVLGTLNVLEYANCFSKLKRFIYLSTSEVFGSMAYRSDESDCSNIGPVGEARWTYAVSKLAGEHLAQAYLREYAIPVTILRPFNVYGPGQVGDGALTLFIKQALKGEDILIHGDGSQIRAWCYIDDFIRGLMMSLTNKKAIGESFNIGNARAVITVYGLAQTVVRVLNSLSKIRFIDAPHADIDLRVPSVKKAKDILGFEATVDLEDGICATANYLKDRL